MTKDNSKLNLLPNISYEALLMRWLDQSLWCFQKFDIVKTNEAIYNLFQTFINLIIEYQGLLSFK